MKVTISQWKHTYLMVKLVINIIKINFIDNAYGILFDGFCQLIFRYRLTWNFMVFSVDNNLSKKPKYVAF